MQRNNEHCDRRRFKLRDDLFGIAPGACKLFICPRQWILFIIGMRLRRSPKSLVHFVYPPSVAASSSVKKLTNTLCSGMSQFRCPILDYESDVCETEIMAAAADTAHITRPNTSKCAIRDAEQRALLCRAFCGP